MSVRELSGVTGDMSCSVNQEGDRGPIPQQLKEVIELVSSANQRIEDCAVEWQAKISQAQWRTLDLKPVNNKSWEQSVLARTYFADKTLDDSFQGLLKHNKTFTDHLQNFVALVSGEQPTMTSRQTCNAQNQCSEFGPGDEEQLLAQNSLLPSLDVSVLEKSLNLCNEKVDSDSVLTKAQESFTDLIKAKIDFDTKFLGFEATLNGHACGTSDPSLGLCQICSKVLECGMGKECKTRKNHRNVQLYKKRTRRSSRIKLKRLESRKTTLKSKERKVADKTVEKSSPDNSCSNNQSAVTTDRVQCT